MFRELSGYLRSCTTNAVVAKLGKGEGRLPRPTHTFACLVPRTSTASNVSIHPLTKHHHYAPGPCRHPGLVTDHHSRSGKHRLSLSASVKWPPRAACRTQRPQPKILMTAGPLSGNALPWPVSLAETARSSVTAENQPAKSARNVLIPRPNASTRWCHRRQNS